jgi:hypothetical protein
MDSSYKFELMYSLIYGEKLSQVTGKDLINELTFAEKHQVLQLSLHATLGDNIKELAYDRFGNIVDDKNIDET